MVTHGNQFQQGTVGNSNINSEILTLQRDLIIDIDILIPQCEPINAIFLLRYSQGTFYIFRFHSEHHKRHICTSICNERLIKKNTPRKHNINVKNVAESFKELEFQQTLMFVTLKKSLWDAQNINYFHCQFESFPMEHMFILGNWNTIRYRSFQSSETTLL